MDVSQQFFLSLSDSKKINVAACAQQVISNVYTQNDFVAKLGKTTACNLGFTSNKSPPVNPLYTIGFFLLV